jgi:hypothetical protein
MTLVNLAYLTVGLLGCNAGLLLVIATLEVIGLAKRK